MFGHAQPFRSQHVSPSANLHGLQRFEHMVTKTKTPSCLDKDYDDHQW
jgi:hypothetical protein